MSTRVVDPELFGVTESSLTLSFTVEDSSGPIDAEARVLVDGETRATVGGTAGTRLVRIEDLAPGARYRVEIDVAGAEPAAPDEWFPEQIETLEAPRGAEVGSFASLNDLHFGEARFGGSRQEDGEFGDAKPGFGLVRETDGDVPYWRVMNEDAVADINETDVDLVVIKGDIADRGQVEQFEAAAETFARFAMPHHAFLGNHDHYALLDGEEVDGLDLLGQPAAPRSLDLGGWKLLLLDTVDPGKHRGVFPDERLRWLADALAETREDATPTLVLTHHQPCPAEFADRFPNDIAILPEHSARMFDLLGQHPQVKGVLIGHTHQNRVRRYAASGPVPFIEVNCTKDYPGGFGHYRLFDDGTFRQEVRRTSSERALAHSTRCRDFFNGFYRKFALGPLSARSFVC
jgi:Icc protein